MTPMSLIEHLLAGYNKQTPFNAQSVTGFVSFCEREMVANPVVGTFYADRGMGLRLADGTQVTTQAAPPAAGDGRMQMGTDVFPSGDNRQGGVTPRGVDVFKSGDQRR